LIAQNISVVTYHDISEESSPFTAQLRLSTRPEIFRKHIAYYKKNFDLIGADELLGVRLPRKPLLVTFDDAYRSVLSVAAPLLKEINAPSIFFVIPAVVRGDTLPIDNVLSFAVEEIGISRTLALMNLKGSGVLSVAEIMSQLIATMPQDEIASLKARIFAALGITEEAARQMSNVFLSRADMRQLAAFQMEVGNHSMTHSHFRALSSRELDIEIGQSRRDLQSLSAQAVRCLSIPYGDERDATHDALAAARRSGHQAIFLVHARSNRYRPATDTYYRVSLRNEGICKLRLAIRVFPTIRSIRHGLTTINRGGPSRQ
jgi:peptidoglycan/xylan/chitin deacetylase (PgdA/CDA1 family)